MVEKFESVNHRRDPLMVRTLNRFVSSRTTKPRSIMELLRDAET